jgi:hypothetical protein
MPRYQFNIFVNGKSDGPSVGTEFRDLGAARADAISACGEMLRDLDGKLPANFEWRMQVTDAATRVLFTLRFSESGHPE